MNENEVTKIREIQEWDHRIIKEIRINNGLDQKEWGDIIGIHPSEMSKYEKGKLKPSLLNLLKILQSFGGYIGIPEHPVIKKPEENEK